MDILLLFIGLFCLLLKRRDLTIAIIVILASSYLQLPLQPQYSVGRFPIVHNISDAGLLLYLFMFVPALFNKNACFKGKIQNAVTVFYVFLLLNGLYDIYKGTSIGDVLRYIKGWSFLSLIYIYKTFKPKQVLNSLRIVCQVTFVVCLCMVILSVFDIDFGHSILVAKGGRGYKPPSFAILCSVLYIINIFKVNNLIRYTYALIYLAPIVLNVKMTYLLSVILIIVIYLLMRKSINISNKIIAVFLSGIVIIGFFTFNTNVSSRLIDLTSGITSALQGDVEDNFSYRLLHATERLNFILDSPSTAIRGIGYISEVNYKDVTFELGVWNDSLKRVDQLNNGDIVWSNLFLRLGLLGLCIYLFMYFRFLGVFYKYRFNNKCNSAFFLFLLISLLFTSLGNDLIGYGDFFIFPILFMNPNLLKS